jgi:DNA repair protein RadB
MGKMSAGSYDLNKWLYGGYDSDIVSVIYGPSGSGKTNFCLLAAASQAKKGNKVIFVDSEGGFSVERVRQIVPDAFEEVLRNILLLKPTNFQEQKEAFKKLQEYLKDEISLIIVDGMTILYRLDFADARKSEEELKKVNSELARLMQILSEIARKREIPVIVTNHVYSWENSMRMVGGDILKYWSKCHIELSNENGRRVAYLRKHRSLPEKELAFSIVNEGIRKRGWI